MVDNYEKCFFYKEGACGESKQAKKSGIWPVKDLKESVTNLLRIRSCDTTDFTERELIENRANTTFPEESFLCAYHRYKYGLLYYFKRECHHPIHDKSKSHKVSSLRNATFLNSKLILRKFGHFPIGGLLCSTCRRFDEVDYEMNDLVKIDDAGNDSDDDFIPNSIEVTLEERSQNTTSLNSILGILNQSPIKYQCTSNENFADYSVRTKEYGKKKYKDFLIAGKDLFAKTFAPTDPEGFQHYVSDESEDEDDEMSLIQLKRLFDCATTSKGKFAIVTIAAQNFLKKDIAHVFEISDRQIKKARSVIKNFGICMEPEKKSIKRLRMNPDLIHHFLDFLFESGAVQTTAYGTNLFVYESGDKAIVPKTCLTGLRSHIVNSYMSYCRDMELNHLRFTSLMKILETIKPASRTQLSGLDIVLVEGEHSIENLLNIVQDILANELESKELILDLTKKIRKIETYLKTIYSMRCRFEDDCASHCARWSLSDPKEKLFATPCTMKHTKRCEDCDSVINTLDKIENLIEKYAGEDTEEKKFDFEVSKGRIINWIGHNIRGFQQNISRTKIFENLDENSAILIRDWSQKVLPISFREAQADYFGKKGISVHVEVFYVLVNNILTKYVLLISIENCDQGLIDTMVVADFAIQQFKKDFPNVCKMYVRSDNANCYSSNGSFEAMYNLLQNHGICLGRIDFCEPQRGKDQCDRESAVFKRYISAYIGDGHRLISALDVKCAVLFRGGPRQTKIGVISIEKSTITNISPIENVSSIHSIEFTTNGMRIWRFFNIGQGKVVQFADTKLVSCYKVISDFGDMTNTGVMGSRKSKVTMQIPFYCTEQNCGAAFDEENDFERHMLEDKHSNIMIRSAMDEVKSYYRVRSSTELNRFRVEKPKQCLSQQRKNNDETPAEKFFKQGWALPVRKSGRLDVKSRAFCVLKFVEGERTGKKYSPEQIAVMIRKAVDPNTKEKMFDAAQYLLPKQIKALMGRLSKSVKRQFISVDELEKRTGVQIMDALELVDQTEERQNMIEGLHEMIMAEELEERQLTEKETKTTRRRKRNYN